MKLNENFLTEIQRFLTADQIKTDPAETQHYGQDWSGVLTAKSAAALFPNSTEQVSEILKAASQWNVSIVPSGGRSGLSAGAVATQGEVVLSLERMNQIGPVDPRSLTVKVGAGAITQAVHEHCEKSGLTWPVDFASKGSSQVGGNLSTNAGGVRVLKYGNTRNWVLGITAVTMSGEILSLNQGLEKNNTGYDLRHLLIGAEGTLAVITEAILKLVPVPTQSEAALLACSSFDQVLRTFEWARKNLSQLSAFEVMDDRCYDAVLAHRTRRAPFSPSPPFIVLMEQQSASTTPLEWNGLEALLEAGLVEDVRLTQSPQDLREFWSLREEIAEAILAGHTVHQEDISVPLTELDAFFASARERYDAAFPGKKAHFFGHIGDGNLHVFVKGPSSSDAKGSQEFLKLCKETDLEVFEILQRYRGSISAEHGIGLLKRHALSFSRSPLEIELMRGIKKVFDPKGLLNPGKILPLITP
jgi:FAD/FMN-containing dehydrogenase